MREAVRQHLTAAVPLAGGWWESFAVPEDQPRPFGVILAGADEPGEGWGGLAVPLELQVHQERTTFVQADTYADQVAAALDNLVLVQGGARYLTTHEATDERDQIDAEWQTITRPVTVRVWPLAFMADDNPAAQALAAWTAAQFPAWHTDPATWTPSDATPGVYWRVEQVAWGRRTARGAPAAAAARARVLAPSYAVRQSVARQLAARLGATLRIPYGASRALLGDVQLDADAHPLRQGQVRVGLQYFELHPVQPDTDGEPITHAEIRLVVPSAP